MGHDIDAARDTLPGVPPAPEKRKTTLEPGPGGSGPHSPGPPEPGTETGPESGGYDDRPDPPACDNAKGGHGAG